MGLREYLYDRRVAFVERWHARPTHLRESLAEHQYWTARDAMAIALYMREYGLADPDVGLVVQLGLNHDEPEKEIGDISGYAKRAYPQLKESLTRIEEEVTRTHLFADLPARMRPHYRALVTEVADHRSLESQIVQVADKISAYMFAWLEVQTGNTLMQRILEQLVDELTSLSANYGWLTKLIRHLEENDDEGWVVPLMVIRRRATGGT